MKLRMLDRTCPSSFSLTFTRRFRRRDLKVQHRQPQFFISCPRQDALERKSYLRLRSPLSPSLCAKDFAMGISKTEANFRRLLAAAPQQQNQYVATLREQLEQLAEEMTSEGLPRVSKANMNDYSKKIEEIASKIFTALPDVQLPREPFSRISSKEIPSKPDGEDLIPQSPSLRRRFVPPSNVEDKTHDSTEADTPAPIMLDATAQAHFQKHRKLQEDLTDEMVGLARQLKQSSLTISQSVQNTEKLLDSTEKAVEESLARTGHANTRATQIYTESSKTSCFTWLLMFSMMCVFIMVLLVIRVT